MPRAKGQLGKATIERAVALARAVQSRKVGERKMPLDVMLEAMDSTYKSHGAEAAFPFARDAAPYLHPRLQSMDAKISGDLRIEVVKFAGTPRQAP